MDRDQETSLKPLAMSLKPLIDSSRECVNSTGLHPAAAQQRMAKETYASERARLLFGQFRKGDANDPDTYTASIAAVLSRYPDEVVRQATDPRTGLATQCDWLPNVKEVHDFCKEIMEAEARAYRRERDLEVQIAGRQEYEKARKKAPAREALQARGFLKEKPVEPIEPEVLRLRFEQARQLYGNAVSLSADARAHLVNAGYSA